MISCCGEELEEEDQGRYQAVQQPSGPYLPANMLEEERVVIFLVWGVSHSEFPEENQQIIHLL